MTNEQILIKAVQKATDNGWVMGAVWLKYINEIKKIKIETKEEKNCANDLKDVLGFHWIEIISQSIIFSHNFAMAFWGVDDKATKANTPWWKYQLQVMVGEPEPLKYLEKFLK